MKLLHKKRPFSAAVMFHKANPAAEKGLCAAKSPPRPAELPYKAKEFCGFGHAMLLFFSLGRLLLHPPETAGKPF